MKKLITELFVYMCLAISCICAFGSGMASSTGCAAVGAALPDIVAAVVDGAQILDMIAQFVDRYFAQHPDPTAQKKVGNAINTARSALQIALRAAQAAKDANDAKVIQAFDEFRQAYFELIELTRPYGVQPASIPSFRASPNGERLEVPDPIAIKLSSAGRR